MAEEEKSQEEKIPALTGFNRVLEILANKISKKAALIAMAMVLVFLLANYLFTLIPALTVNQVFIVMGIICGLAVFGVTLQYSIDYQNAKNRKEILEKKEKDLEEDPG